jgi:pilus assembly protein CpaC
MSVKRARSKARWRGLAAFGCLCVLAAPGAGGAVELTVPEVPNRAAVPAPSDIRIGAEQPARKLTLSVGRSSIVELPADAAEIFIGNPQVANAVVRSARKLFVLAVANGQTTIFALDSAGRRIATLELVVNSRDISDLQAILRTAMPNTDIHVQAVNDTIILTGFVDSAVDAQKAQDIASAYVGYTAVGGGTSSAGTGASVSIGTTQVIQGNLINSLVIREKEQVMLKVSVVEVERNVIKQLGVTLGAGNAAYGSTGAFAANNPSLNPLFNNGGIGSLAFMAGSTDIASQIQAFERNGVAHVLAEPTVTAISGESAKFTAGGTIPVANSSSISTVNGRTTCTISTTLEPYGVILNFTPTVLSGGRISLHIATEVTEIDGTRAAQYSCSNQTGFRTRKNETTVELPSGGSLVTAGLIQQTDKQAIAGTPGLMNLPILGALFRSRDYMRNESELMIVVTPYIARTLRPDQIAKPDDGFQDASDPQTWFLGRVNRIYSRADNPELLRNYRGRVGFIND